MAGRRVCLGARLRFIVVGAGNQLCAETANGVRFGTRRRSRQENGERQSSRPCSECKRLSVIARRRRDERRRILPVPLGEGQDGIECAANLEGEGWLQRFEFEQNLTARVGGEPLRSAKRRAKDASFEATGRRTNVVERNQELDGLAA